MKKSAKVPRAKKGKNKQRAKDKQSGSANVISREVSELGDLKRITRTSSRHAGVSTTQPGESNDSGGGSLQEQEAASSNDGSDDDSSSDYAN